MAAIGAIKCGEVCGRTRSLVAGLASSGLMWNFPIGMGKCRACPCRSVVARGASARGREAISCVVRHRSAKRGRALPLRCVAAVAIGRRRGRAGVAEVAGRSDMCAGERESGRAVIESRAQPRSGGVAGRAGRWVTPGNMVRYGAAKGGCALIILRMAAIAIRGQRAAVIAVHVAQSASHCRVRARQRERSRAVIERRRRPVRRGMADRAIGWKAGRDVIRNRAAQCCRAVPIRRVAAVARCRAERVVVAHVAGRARRGRWRNVHSGQRKTRGAVIECGRGKAHSCVAIGAVGHRK